VTAVDSLQVEVTDKGGLKREIAFQVPADAVASAFDAACDNIGRGLKLPGFRAGKVPRKVIRSRYRGQVDNDVIQRLVPDYWRQAISQAAVEPVSEPEFDPIDLQEGQPLRVVAQVEVEPEVTLAPYQELEVTAVDLEVTDEDLTAAHRSLQETLAALEPCEADHLAAAGDQVVMDFEGKVDGAPFDGGKGQGYVLTLGEGHLIPGFEDQIQGHAGGETFDVTVTFPDDYHAENLRAKEAVFAVTVTEIKRKVLPDVDDAFASQVGEFEDLEGLNRTLREEILAKRKGDQRQIQRRQAFAKLVEMNTFDPPDRLVEDALDDIVQHRQRLVLMQGKSPEEAGFDPAEVRREAREEAVAQARGRVILSRIAKAEGVAVTEAEVADEIARLAREYRRAEEEIRQRISADPLELDRMRRHLRDNKVLDWVVDRAKVRTVSRGKSG
jgi:trigger factor